MKAAPEYDLDRIGDRIRGGEGNWAWKMTHDIRSFMCSCTGRVSLSLVRSPGSLLVSRLPLLLKVPPQFLLTRSTNNGIFEQPSSGVELAVAQVSSITHEECRSDCAAD